MKRPFEGDKLSFVVYEKQRCKSWNLFILFILSIFLAFSSISCTKDEIEPELEQVSVRLKWIIQGQFAGVLVAKEKGFFEENGLEVTINPGGVDLNSIHLVASGSDQFGISTADQIILARSKGIPLTAFAAVFQKSPVVLFALKSSGIESPNDFVGKTVGMKYGYSDETLFKALIKKLNIDGSKINLTPVRYFSLSLFLAGKVDVWPGYSTNEPIIVRKKSHEVNVFYYDDYGIHLYADTFFTTEKTIKNKPKLVEGFLRAVIKGWKWTIEHPEESADIVLKYNKKLSRDHELNMIQECIKLVSTGDALTHGILWMDPQKWEDAKQILIDADLIDASIDLPKAYTTEFLKKIYSDVNLKRKRGQEHFLCRPRGCRVGGKSLRIDTGFSAFSL